MCVLMWSTHLVVTTVFELLGCEGSGSQLELGYDDVCLECIRCGSV